MTATSSLTCLQTNDNDFRRQLIAKAKEGDMLALTAYRDLNRGLEETIVRRYARWVSEEEVDDLRQEGFLGLVKGIKAYDLTKMAKSGKPEGYIYSWVRAYISNYARSHGRSTNNPAENVSELREESDSSEACSSPEDLYASKTVMNRLRTILEALPKKERAIAERRFLKQEPDTLEHIGLDFGVSRERIRQIETQLKTKLRLRIGEDPR